MELSIVKLATAALLPPGCFLLLLFSALWIRAPRLKAGLLLTVLIVMAGFSTSFVAERLMLSLSRAPHLDRDGARAGEAIVILAGGRAERLLPDAADDIGASTLVRVRHGARLAKATKLPVLVSGGAVFGDAVPLADLMARSLLEFGVTVRWRERRSRNTAQNAVFSAEILLADGIRTVVLVTHYWHMPRAVASFEAAGFDVLPAPVLAPGRTLGTFQFRSLLPSADALATTSWALHEYLGLLWYRLRYGV